MRRGGVRLLAVMMACGAASYAGDAVASEPATPASDPSSTTAPQPGVVTTREWYGWQTLTVDGASVLIFAGGLLANDFLISCPGIVGFVAGAPVIHALHGRPWMAVGDAVLRLVVLPLGAFIGAAVISSHCGGSNDAFGLCVVSGGFAGAGIGASIPIALDAGVFAYRTHWVDTPAPTGLVWQPGVIAVPHGVAAGVSGAF